jgi:hypothetical protein
MSVDELRSPTPPRLDRFLTYWYGPADREPSDPAGGDRRLPRPLREWFEVTSQWSAPLAQQNTVLDGESVRIEDSKLVFWVENQGVWTWAVDPDADDGQVYDRESEADQPWQRTGVRLSVFLVHVAVFEAIFNARHGGTSAWIRPEHLSEVLAPLAPIPGTAWRWPSPGHDLYSGDGLLALAGPNDGPGETPETSVSGSGWSAPACW